jgi:hypothetical protein
MEESPLGRGGAGAPHRRGRQGPAGGRAGRAGGGAGRPACSTAGSGRTPRDGSWDFAITADLADAGAYRADNLGAEHDRIRRELFGPPGAEIARVQFST